jgi:cytoskeletal protein CcmA (bactofilin family)
MFKKRDTYADDVQPHNVIEDPRVASQQANTIPKGSKLTGDINVSCDLELSGEVEGNINSDQNSNIVIQGVCKGNIRTKEGSVTIEGELNGGDIFAGGDIKVTGKFNGGRAEARGKIMINGEFNGKFEGNEIEIGSGARGKGELHYKEHVAISKGAKVEAHISQIKEELKGAKKPADMKVINMELTQKEKNAVQ